MTESIFSTWERAIKIAEQQTPEPSRFKIRGRSPFDAGFNYCQRMIIQALRQAQSEEIKSRITK